MSRRLHRFYEFGHQGICYFSSQPLLCPGAPSLCDALKPSQPHYARLHSATPSSPSLRIDWGTGLRDDVAGLLSGRRRRRRRRSKPRPRPEKRVIKARPALLGDQLRPQLLPAHPSTAVALRHGRHYVRELVGAWAELLREDLEVL